MVQNIDFQTKLTPFQKETVISFLSIFNAQKLTTSDIHTIIMHFEWIDFTPSKELTAEVKGFGFDLNEIRNSLQAS